MTSRVQGVQSWAEVSLGDRPRNAMFFWLKSVGFGMVTCSESSRRSSEARFAGFEDEVAAQ